MAIPRFRPSLSLGDAGALVRSLLGGDETEFEARFGRQLLDGQPVVLAPSGRVALYWLLRAMDLADGDEVVTQAFNFSAVPAAIEAAGARARFVDLCPGTFEIDPAALEEVISPRTRAVVITHLFGNPVALEKLLPICERRGVTVIEDCAQAAGASHAGRPLGTYGRASFFTFGPTKNLTLLGGGAAASADLELAGRVRELAGRHPRMGRGATLRLAATAAGLTLVTGPPVFSGAFFPALRLAERLRLDPVHAIMGEPPTPLQGVERAHLPSPAMAAVGLSQLARLDDLNAARRRNGRALRVRLEEVRGIDLPPSREGNVFVSFPIFHRRREALARALQARGVDVDLGFMCDCASLPLFTAAAADCPHARRAATEIVHLPVHPHLAPGDLETIAVAVAAAAHELS